MLSVYNTKNLTIFVWFLVRHCSLETLGNMSFISVASAMSHILLCFLIKSVVDIGGMTFRFLAKSISFFGFVTDSILVTGDKTVDLQESRHEAEVYFPIPFEINTAGCFHNVYENERLRVCIVRRWAMRSTRVDSKVCVVHAVVGF